MIANSADEQYMHMIQAMIDLDLSDSLDPNRLWRTTCLIPSNIWEE